MSRLLAFLALPLSLAVVAAPVAAAGHDDCYQAGDPDRAIVGCSAVLADEGTTAANRANAYNNRCNAYNSKGEYDRAIADCNRAIELNQNYAEAYDNRGDAYDGKGEHDRAIADFTRAIMLNPKDAAAHYDRGLAYRHKGDNDRAIADYTRAIALKPDYAEAYGNRGNAHGAKGDYDAAIADHTRALQLNPNDAQGYYNRASTYFRKGDYDAAIADYTHAIGLNPNDSEAYQNRALAYNKKGDYGRAAADQNRASELAASAGGIAGQSAGGGTANSVPYEQRIADFALRTCYENIHDLNRVLEMANSGGWERLPPGAVEQVPANQKLIVEGWAAPAGDFKLPVTIKYWEGGSGDAMNRCTVHAMSAAAPLVAALQPHIALKLADRPEPGKEVYLVTSSGDANIIMEVQSAGNPVVTAISFIAIQVPNPNR